MKDIRWHQRLSNFELALNELSEAVTTTTQRQLNKLEEQGLIQSFEYNYELSWNAIKDFYEAQGETNIQGSRDAIRLAFKRGLIEDGELWMQMIKSRTLTSHTYDKTIAADIVIKIIQLFYPAFLKLYEKLTTLKQKT
ncbi:MAG: nucleotidyltransferase substrate binding protein [Gammaproteobacteria bacterium]|nr:nucleotidyltransferase substrate binding protein [Gammaproteobacteria bacterium]